MPDVAPSTHRETTIRRSLLNNMLFLVSLFALVILLAIFLGAEQLTRSLSRVLIGQAIDRTEAEVRQFISPVEKTLTVLGGWVGEGRLDPDTGAGARELLLPLFRVYPQLYGALVLDPDYRVLHVNRYRDDWRLSLVDGNGVQPSRALYPLTQSAATWEPIDYRLDPRTRPWYQGVLTEDEDIHWTEAYRFFASGYPGITAAIRVEGADGRPWVIALDVLLEDISTFTRNFDLGYGGVVLVTDGRGQLIGLPNLPRFASPSARERAYLKRPHDLDFSLAADASAAFQPDPQGSVLLEPVQFRSEGRIWWGQGKWIPLNRTRELFTGVLVRERDLLGTIDQWRVMLLTVIVLVTAFAVYRAAVLARRYSEPIRSLADQSLRISEGNLEDTPQIRSSLTEVNHLARSHETMRRGLANLLRLEDDLQLARQIQQKTFPRSFPNTLHYDITAGSLPADATGGDTFDVVGIERIDGQVRLCEERPEEIYLILADVTGHGVGPALTASQVRAMFRMGVRMGRPVNEIAAHMNDQLTADAHGGRFVTAWLGSIDRDADRIRMLSAGQAPILKYTRADDRVETFSADAPPFGVAAPGGPFATREINLRVGDILAVLSDGVFDARAFDGERFGNTRVTQLLRVHAGRPAREIIMAIRDELRRFLNDSVAHDDQTGILIKRV